MRSFSTSSFETGSFHSVCLRFIQVIACFYAKVLAFFSRRVVVYYCMDAPHNQRTFNAVFVTFVIAVIFIIPSLSLIFSWQLRIRQRLSVVLPTALYKNSLTKDKDIECETGAGVAHKASHVLSQHRGRYGSGQTRSFVHRECVKSRAPERGEVGYALCHLRVFLARMNQELQRSTARLSAVAALGLHLSDLYVAF